MFNRLRFPVEIILVCVRWYCKYGISYRDLAEMMQEPRGSPKSGHRGSAQNRP
jgi:transposase-like protein